MFNQTRSNTYRARGYGGIPLDVQYEKKTKAEEKRARRRAKRLAGHGQQKAEGLYHG